MFAKRYVTLNVSKKVNIQKHNRATFLATSTRSFVSYLFSYFSLVAFPSDHVKKSMAIYRLGFVILLIIVKVPRVQLAEISGTPADYLEGRIVVRFHRASD